MANASDFEEHIIKDREGNQTQAKAVDVGGKGRSYRDQSVILCQCSRLLTSLKQERLIFDLCITEIR